MYLKANSRLKEAMDLTSRSAAILAPFLDGTTPNQAFQAIRANRFFTVTPRKDGQGKLDLLRSKIQAARGSQAASVKIP